MKYSKPLLKLIEEFQKLPGIGPKSAERMAFHILKQDINHVQEFSQALLQAKSQIKKCSVCMNLSSNDPCEVCMSSNRDQKLICVISESKDLSAIERTNEFRGTYHVLGGLLSPLDGVGPEELNIKALISRIATTNPEEIIIALDTSTEGEATTLYLHRILSPLCPKITRLAFGLPVGTELEYADELTLIRAFEGRFVIH